MDTGSEARRILLVEDEKNIRDAVAAYLERAGYWVTPAADGQEAVDAFSLHQFDLVILDLMLPRLPGEKVCRIIRDTSDVPIIMLTAKGEVEDRIVGLELGADDYLIKPFSPRELVARVRALLRRAGRTEEKAAGNSLTIGTITLDLDARNAYRNGQLADLTAKEFDVIEFLMRNPNRVYSREALLDTIWAYEYRSDIRTVDVHIRRLREKLEENPAEPKYILTKWGVGYYFRK